MIYKLLKSQCYDEGSEVPWVHETRYSKNALTQRQIEARYTWAWDLEGNILNPEWCWKNLIWTDICNTILPTTQALHQKQVVARKKKKGWGSPDSRKKSINLVGDKKVTKQNQWGTKRVWWAPVLSRGKLHIEVLGTDFPGENEDGAAILVDYLRTAMNKRFPGPDQPKTLFVDRGQGFYEKNHGKITEPFKEALRRNGFKAYYGDNAKAQPGAMHELMLHETAVSWIRHLEEQTRPKEPWKEGQNVAEYASRMKRIALDINKRHEVDNLCRELPERVEMLIEAEGDRINKYSPFLKQRKPKEKRNLDDDPASQEQASHVEGRIMECLTLRQTEGHCSPQPTQLPKAKAKSKGKRVKRGEKQLYLSFFFLMRS